MLELALCRTPQWTWASAFSPLSVFILPSLSLVVFSLTSFLFGAASKWRRLSTITLLQSESTCKKSSSRLNNVAVSGLFCSNFFPRASPLKCRIIYCKFWYARVRLDNPLLSTKTSLSRHPINGLNECISHVVSRLHPSHCHGIQHKTRGDCGGNYLPSKCTFKG